MKILAKYTNKTKNIILTTFSVVLVSIVASTSLFAWGPERATFTIEEPASYVTFNSITNNPDYGDERNFVTIKDASNTAAGGWVDNIDIEHNKEYLVRMYVHNNAAANLNLVANNVLARFNVPDESATEIQIDGRLSASNSNPTAVWDQAVFSNDKPFHLDYVEGSAKYINNVFTDGTALSDNIISSGAALGYDSMNGNIPGCYQYSGLVVFKIKAIAESDFVIKKTVRETGAEDTTFRETVGVDPGDQVDFQIYFENTGGAQLTNVIIKDALPTGLTYVDDSTYVYTSDGLAHVIDAITTAGLNIGGYLPEGNAYIKFTAQVADNDDLAECGLNTLINTATAITSVGQKSDDATVTTGKTCIDVVVEECKPGIPVGDARCEETPVVTPVTELPKTGLQESVMAIIGIGAVGASAVYYIQSRRKLRLKIMNTVSAIEVGNHPAHHHMHKTEPRMDHHESHKDNKKE